MAGVPERLTPSDKRDLTATFEIFTRRQIGLTGELTGIGG